MPRPAPRRTPLERRERTDRTVNRAARRNAVRRTSPLDAGGRVAAALGGRGLCLGRRGDAWPGYPAEHLHPRRGQRGEPSPESRVPRQGCADQRAVVSSLRAGTRARRRARRPRDLCGRRSARGTRAGQGARRALGPHGRARCAAPARPRSPPRPRGASHGTARSGNPACFRVSESLPQGGGLARMNDDRTASHGWLRRLVESLSGEPRDLAQLSDLLADAKDRGLIEADVLSMMEGVLQVSTIQVRDVMVPRAQMVVVQREDPPEKILPTVIESGHSRFPVVGEDRDEVVGILLAKDLLRYFAEDSAASFDIRECLRPAVFIPESKRLNVLLREFRNSHNHMAIVVEDYGGVWGLLH